MLNNQVPSCELESKMKIKCSWVSRQIDTERQRLILNNTPFTVYLKMGKSKSVSQINIFNMFLSSHVKNWVREKKG